MCKDHSNIRLDKSNIYAYMARHYTRGRDNCCSLAWSIAKWNVGSRMSGWRSIHHVVFQEPFRSEFLHKESSADNDNKHSWADVYNGKGVMGNVGTHENFIILESSQPFCPNCHRVFNMFESSQPAIQQYRLGNRGQKCPDRRACWCDQGTKQYEELTIGSGKTFSSTNMPFTFMTTAAKRASETWLK